MKITSSFSLRKRENGISYLGYEENGKRFWKTTKCSRKVEALQFLKNYNAEEFVPPVQLKLSELFSQLSNAKLLRDTTLGSYSTAVKLLTRHCGDKLLTDYKLSDLLSFKQHQIDRTISETSINIWVRSLVAVLSFAVKRQYLKQNPFSLSVTIKIPRKPPLFMSQSDFETLLKIVPNEILRDFYLVAANTGMRLSEILNLKWSNISLEKKQVAVVNTEEFTTKSGKSRIVPMNDTVFETLTRRHAKRRGEYVFSKSNGFKYSKDYVSHRFKKYIRRAKLNDKYHVHTLRHSFASWLALKEVPIFSIQQLLGHASVNTTLQYSRLSSSGLHSAVNRL